MKLVEFPAPKPDETDAKRSEAVFQVLEFFKTMPDLRAVMVIGVTADGAMPISAANMLPMEIAFAGATLSKMAVDNIMTEKRPL